MLLTFVKKTKSIFFSLITIGIITFLISSYLNKYHIDPLVIQSANVFFFFITILSMLMQMSAMNHKNPNVFIRSVMGGLFIKMVLTALALVIYFVASGKNFNTKAVFVSLFLYLVYLGIEVATMISLNKPKNA